MVAAPEPGVSILLMMGGVALVGLAWLRRLHRVPLTTGFAIFSLAALGMTSASADPIDVPDASFETNPWVGWTYANPDVLPGWVFNAPAGSGYGSLLYAATFTSPDTSMGQDYAFIDNDAPGEPATLTSAASLGTITADTTYTLTVALGNPDDAGSGAGGPLDFDPMAEVPMGGVSLALLSNGQPFAIKSIPAGSVSSGDWQDFSLSYTTTDSDPIIGEQLTLQLGTGPGSGGTEGASFDNVQLDASPSDTSGDGSTEDDGDGNGSGGDGVTTTPEPSSSGLLGLGLGALGWLARWRSRNASL